MPAPDLKPQVPGEPLADAPVDPQAEKRAELEAIAALNAPEVIEGLSTMSPDELRLLREIEAAGKGRVTVLGAIDAALEPPTDPEPDPEPDGAGPGPDAPASDEPIRASQQPKAKLTDAGWVVPEPDPKG